MYSSVYNGSFLMRGGNTFLHIEWESVLQGERLRIMAHTKPLREGTRKEALI